MSDVRRIDPGEIALMLYEAAQKHGYTLVEADEMWKGGELAEPDLRDLWLIYGSVVDDDRALDYQTSIDDGRRLMAQSGFVEWVQARITELDERLAAIEGRS